MWSGIRRLYDFVFGTGEFRPYSVLLRAGQSASENGFDDRARYHLLQSLEHNCSGVSGYADRKAAADAHILLGKLYYGEDYGLSRWHFRKAIDATADREKVMLYTILAEWHLRHNEPRLASDSFQSAYRSLVTGKLGWLSRFRLRRQLNGLEKLLESQ